MAFEQQESKTPTSIGAIFVALTDYDGVPANHIATFNVEVLDQNGDTLRTLTGQLQQHLSGTQQQRIVDFLAALRTQAEGEILP